MARGFFAYLSKTLMLAPVCVPIIWHITNHGWPSDDAANYMVTAYQQYRAFQDGALSDGLRAVYTIRGWRPILFPTLATPFLWLFKGDVLAATGSTLTFCFLVCQIYTYAIARRYLDPLRASLVAAFVGTSQVIASYSLVFFSELAWLALFLGSVFHLLESEQFRNSCQAGLAGVLLGLATLVRPAETAGIAGIPIICLVALAHRQGSVRLADIVPVVGFAALTTLLLVASAFLKEVDYRVVLSLGAIFILLHALLMKLRSQTEVGTRGINLFVILFVGINLLWWANSMPQLYSWVYETSFGVMAQVTKDLVLTREGGGAILSRIFLLYLFPSGVLMGVIGLIGALPGERGISERKSVRVLGIVTFGLLLPMCVLYVVTNTSDSRRVFIGMCFLLILVAILALQPGPLRRVREIAVFVVVALQLSAVLESARGEPPPFNNPISIHSAIQTPKSKVDQHVALIARLLELGVPRRSMIAVYTIALFQSRDRIYEPAALQLAALTTGSGLGIIYYWDVGDYATVVRRLMEQRVSFLLIDRYRDNENRSAHQPSVQFASALLDELDKTDTDPPGLRRVASFKMEGREQVLFEIKRPKIGASSTGVFGPEGLLTAEAPGWHSQFPPKYPQEIEIDFGEDRSFQTLELQPQTAKPDRAPRAIAISVSRDGAAWKIIGNVDDLCGRYPAAGGVQIPFNDVISGRMVRIKILSNCGSELLTLQGVSFR